MASNTTGSTISKQTYGTPQCFVEMVGYKFQGEVFGVDLAANNENAKAQNYLTIEKDALSLEWGDFNDLFYDVGGFRWLNPEYRQNPKWFKKAYEEAEKGVKLCVLSINNPHAKWYRSYCLEKCLIMEMDGRLIFEGEENPYPKDLALYVYNSGMVGKVFWDWKADLEEFGYRWDSKKKIYDKIDDLPF